MAPCFRIVRRDRNRVGNLVLFLVSRQPAKSSEGERSRIGTVARSGTQQRRTRGCSLEKVSRITDSLAPLAAVLLFLLRLVFLHHLVADLFEGSGQIGVAQGGVAGGLAAIPGRSRGDIFRRARRLVDPGTLRWRKNPPLSGGGRLHRR